MKNILLVLGGALIATALPQAATAQFASNNEAPISGSADNADYRPGVTVLSGQVDIRQDDVRILADTMKIYSSGSPAQGDGGFGDISKIEAIDNFYYITPDQEVKGQRGVYEQSKNNFTVTGNVILLQGQDNVVTGDRLVYNLSTNQAVVTGNCRGRKCGSKGRVNILIKNQKNNGRIG